MRRFVLFGAFALAGLALDQWSKLWAVDRLAHACPVLRTRGDLAPPAFSRCRDEGSRVQLAEPAVELGVAASNGDAWRVRCKDAKPCLSGEVVLGAPAPASAPATEEIGSLKPLGAGVSYELRASDGRKKAALSFVYERAAPPLVLIDGYLSLEYAENRGAAWSFLADSRCSSCRGGCTA